MVVAGLVQTPLTITSAVLATAAIITDPFPDKAVSEEQLMLIMGVVNVAFSFFGGMLRCHGSSGLAGQCYLGARTGGRSILEGLIEISLGMFLAKALLGILSAFAMPLIDGITLMVSVELAKNVSRLRRWPLALFRISAALSAAANRAMGFVATLALTWKLESRWPETEPQSI